MRIIGRGQVSDGLYLLQERVSKASLASRTSSVSLFQLHCRFGHPSLGVLRKLCP